MKPHHKPKYTINRTESFIRQSQQIRKRHERFGELLNAIDWALQRKPHFFSNVSGNYYLLKTKELANPDFPKLKVLYHIVEEDWIVVLINIEDD